MITSLGITTKQHKADLLFIALKSMFLLKWKKKNFLFMIPSFFISVVFVSGSKYYKRNNPTRNVMANFFNCVWVSSRCWFCCEIVAIHHYFLFVSFFVQIGLKTKCFGKRNGRTKHWLDPAIPKFGPDFVSDVKSVFKASALFILYPPFWFQWYKSKSKRLYKNK